MRKKRFLLIGLQVCALTAFIMMALGSASQAPVATSSVTHRVNRVSCGDPDYVFLGVYDNPTACSNACSTSGFSTYCVSGDNCYCK